MRKDCLVREAQNIFANPWYRREECPHSCGEEGLERYWIIAKKIGRKVRDCVYWTWGNWCHNFEPFVASDFM